MKKSSEGRADPLVFPGQFKHCVCVTVDVHITIFVCATFDIRVTVDVLVTADVRVTVDLRVTADVCVGMQQLRARITHHAFNMHVTLANIHRYSNVHKRILTNEQLYPIIHGLKVTIYSFIFTVHTSHTSPIIRQSKTRVCVHA